MNIAITRPLFPWDALEDNPSLLTIRRFLESVPDARLLEDLRRHRGKGRDDYPVRVLWGVLLLTILLRHSGIAACLEDLQRNDGLCQLIGIDGRDNIPKDWSMSRFLDVLGQDPHRSNLEAVFAHMVQRLGVVVPDLGEHTAGDSSALNARRLRQDAKAEPAATLAAQQRRAPAPPIPRPTLPEPPPMQPHPTLRSARRQRPSRPHQRRPHQRRPHQRRPHQPPPPRSSTTSMACRNLLADARNIKTTTAM
jgi:hypothetical protein